LRNKKLVGIITESDMFRVLTELLGGRRSGLRVTAAVTGDKGTLAKLSKAIYEANGDIVGLGVNELPEAHELHYEVMLKVQDVSKDKIVALMEQEGAKLIDIRDA
jgi:acetoin utilization protein AcuB